MASTKINCPTLKTINQKYEFFILWYLIYFQVKTIIYLSTEYVEPLQSFLSFQNNLQTDIMKQYIAWGISTIIVNTLFDFNIV